MAQNKDICAGIGGVMPKYLLKVDILKRRLKGSGMGWNTALTATSAVGDGATYYPDTMDAHGYTSAAFTAPKKGIYRFTLKGSGGYARANLGRHAAGGEGGLTDGYLLLESGQTVYVGCGGPCSAAWAASANPGNAGVAALSQSSLYFVAGGGGGGGSTWGENGTGPCGTGGAGGGSAGGDGGNVSGGRNGTGGTQSAGGTGYNSDNDPWNNGAYGVGSKGVYTNNDDENGSGGSGTGGDGGDGYYGGGAGGSAGSDHANGGGGGSGYVHAATLSVAGKSYVSATSQGGGAASNSAGSVTVTFAAVAELPVSFNGTQLTQLIFNGSEVSGLVYNGTTIFAGRYKACLKRMAARFACLRETRALLASWCRGRRWKGAILLSLPCAGEAAS